MKIIILLVFFSNYAVAAEPKLNMTGLQCREINFQYLEPKKPESIESLYCSYQVGLKNFDTYNMSSTGVFSTQENTDAHVAWIRPILKKKCEVAKDEALELLKKEYPNYNINCSRYFNFNNLMNAK